MLSWVRKEKITQIRSPPRFHRLFSTLIWVSWFPLVFRKRTFGDKLCRVFYRPTVLFVTQPSEWNSSTDHNEWKSLSGLIPSWHFADLLIKGRCYYLMSQIVTEIQNIIHNISKSHHICVPVRQWTTITLSSPAWENIFHWTILITIFN